MHRPIHGARATLAGVNGLRAAAAILVLSYHVSLASGLTRGGALAPLLAGLKSGVAVFFVISGMLLYLPYARAIRDRASLPDWRQYATRRSVRILPGYWVLLSILAIGPLAATIQSANWWRYYGLTQIYSPTTLFGGLGVAWSLAVEISFYAVLPLLARAVAALVRGLDDPVPRQLAVAGALAAVALGTRFALAGSLTGAAPRSGLVMATALPGMLDWFAIGIALAILVSSWEHGSIRAPALAAVAARPTASWMMAAACFAVGAFAQRGDLFLPLDGVAAHLAFGAASAFLVLPVTAEQPRAIPMRVLTQPVIVWLGTISYGIYLWHVPVLNTVRGWDRAVPAQAIGVVPTVGLFAAVAGGGAALGAASWYFVERPAQRLAGRRTAAAVPLGPPRAPGARAY